MTEERKRVLAMCGGGVRGLYSITLLSRWEQQLADHSGHKNLNIASYFDLLAGTSIGGILALGLASGKNARYLAKLLNDNRKVIFPQKRDWFGISLLCRAKYEVEPLRELLEKEFGDLTMGQLQSRCIIPAVNISTGNPLMFKTGHLDEYVRDRKISVCDVALSTSAAPTYFPPHKCTSSTLNAYMCDGGLIANSPALIAFHEAVHKLCWDQDSIHVLGIDALNAPSTIDHGTIGRAGYWKLWGKGERLIDITMSSNSNMQDYMLKQMIGDRFTKLSTTIPMQQAKRITLDNSDDYAAEAMIAHAESVEANEYRNVAHLFDEPAATFSH
ncbi:CBASS cGAMP-activated phospholipase [Vibrio sp. YIC-376]|uniref:CBASS cGAMP-activated phospholipase n=1 Tax=Vibrio sp. YIC-376 TaxID=3136162 RepID=UPI00402AA05D